MLIFFDNRWEDRKFWTEWYQALSELNHLLISSWIKFDLLLLFQNISALTQFQSICLLFLCHDFDLHSGDETATYT
jgi:hypothetical protein